LWHSIKSYLWWSDSQNIENEEIILVTELNKIEGVVVSNPKVRFIVFSTNSNWNADFTQWLLEP
jgi:hypothetical protein